MNIWVDFGHIPQFNFYKPFILKLVDKGHTVYLTVLARGRMPNIVRHELDGISNVHVYVIGRHRMNKMSALLEANLLRNIQLILWAKGKHIDMSFSNVYQSAMVSWLFRFKSYCFGDDFRGLDVPLKKLFSTCSYYCIYEVPKCMTVPYGHIILPCLKEWAYLCPKVFKANVKTLEKYELKPKKYIFLREVSVGTVNYVGQVPQAILAVKDLISGTGLTVLLSLEEKNKRNEYPEEWILLREPVEDIHSLMYYAAGLVSSGDSMAREAALLGIASYYLGMRHSMPANLAASKVANLQSDITMSFEEWISKMGSQESSAECLMEEQRKVREYIDEKFIDINEYMYNLVKQEMR